MDTAANYIPSCYFYRSALRSAATKEEAIDVGLHAVAELEQLKAWVREQNMIPPKWFLMQAEIDVKGWGAVVRFPSSAVLPPCPDEEL